MLRKPKRQSVCTAFLKNEQGFTFISMFLMITMIAVTLPLLGYLIKSSSLPANTDELSIQQFFLFLRNDVINAREYDIEPTVLHLVQNDGTTAKIEKYGSHIRRQVDGKGHEIYIRDIKEVEFIPHPYGIHAFITSVEGETYEKKIIFYQ